MGGCASGRWHDMHRAGVHRAGGAGASSKSGTPLFIVAGACPSIFAGMQCVMYSAMHSAPASSPVGAASVDFWWIKPIAGRNDVLESKTLPKNSKGPHKNTPGNSQAVYAPIAALFTAAESGAISGASGASSSLSFALMRVDAGEQRLIWRATLSSAEQPGVTRYLVLVWQELWSSPLARTRWIQGKLLYQREPGEQVFYAAPYRISGKAITVDVEAEERVTGLMPPDAFKLGCTVPIKPPPPTKVQSMGSGYTALGSETASDHDHNVKRTLDFRPAPKPRLPPRAGTDVDLRAV